MKKTLLLCALLVGSLLIYKPVDAQFRIKVQINTHPSWGHGGYGHRDGHIIYRDGRDRRNNRRDFDKWNRKRDWNYDRRHNKNGYDNNRRGGQHNDGRHHDEHHGRGK